jgi:hypothetical protein
VREALSPLEAEGWTVVESNVEVVFPDGQKFGDVDILIVSPTGIAYSIDAKNGTERVWYDARRDLVVFDRGWHGALKKRPPYPVSRAEFLARWVRMTYGYECVVPVMCFTQTIDLRWEHLVSSILYLVKIGNVCRTLRSVDHWHSKRPINGKSKVRPEPVLSNDLDLRTTESNTIAQADPIAE